ncbi:MAG: hypothetical protein IJP44_09750 [Bacteroidales bacterium]|nr:hypothetical protein [Bacteroidales bacterium]
MQNFLNINDEAINGSQPLAVGKEPVGDFPCEKCFVGFEGFVTNRQTTNQQNKS